MARKLILPLAALCGLQLDAQALNLRGKVTDKQGRAVANAVVTLTPKGLADTTAADGAYAINDATAIAPAGLADTPGRITASARRRTRAPTRK